VSRFRSGNSNSKFEIVTSGYEALRGGKFIPESKLVCYKQRDEEDHTKVDDQGRRHAHDRDDLMHDLVALRSKEHQDSEQKADKRPRSGELQEYLIILAWAG
jgi:hypothetical protein